MYNSIKLFIANGIAMLFYPCRVHVDIIIYMLMRDEEGRKKEASKVIQTAIKAKQRRTPKAVTFPKENELPRVGLEPMTLYTLDRTLY